MKDEAGKFVALKANADAALNECPTVKKVIVVQRTKSGEIHMQNGRMYGGIRRCQHRHKTLLRT